MELEYQVFGVTDALECFVCRYFDLLRFRFLKIDD